MQSLSAARAQQQHCVIVFTRPVRGRLARCCSFSFADSERANRPTGRRNRYVEKKHESELRSIAQGLCNFNGKQLQAVAHLLPQEHLKQIRIGMDIPPTNQGRRRQVGLVAGLLRSDLDDATLSKLSEAVQQAARFNLPYSDADVEQQLDVWLEGLAANDQEVVTEVFELLQKQDWQQVRTWVRQLQQQEQQQQQEQLQDQQQQELQRQLEQPQQLGVQQLISGGALNPSQGLGDGVQTQDPEVLQLIAQLNQQPQQQQQQQQDAKPKGGKGKSNPAAAARRSLRRLLKPLALERL